MAKLSPVFNDQTIDANGDPYVGAKLFTYVAGSSTKQAVYTDAAGTVPHLNPIELNSLGFPAQGAIWLPEGVSIKFVLAPPTDTDPPTSPIKTIDNVQGVNDTSVTISEWQSSGLTPTYVSATSFTLPGDQTTEFHMGRRLQSTNAIGTIYSTITESAYTSLTNITVENDSGSLDLGLSAVNYAVLTAVNNSLPGGIYGSGSALIQRQTASVAVSSFDFTTIYNSTFNSYELEIERLLPTTNSTSLLLQFQVSGSWIAAGYYWANWRWTTIGSGVIGQGGTGSGIALNAATADNMSNSGNPAAFIIRISNCAQTSSIKRVGYDGSYIGSATINLCGRGESAGSGAITGFRLIMDSGTIQAGAVVSLRGLK